MYIEIILVKEPNIVFLFITILSAVWYSFFTYNLFK